ncbi:hypothetical protein [Peredibacter starrii]|uniref:Uncharacterized protein n=1 Tax=Peredibacter starrii TaxID=28202 RepID=A0AAX4HMU8_9BACT|nr:hypothetical protein [Peredibacter starrii]WPU64541.1 hypothetical protein SOO65_17755 [Peredibacter starrii]
MKKKAIKDPKGGLNVHSPRGPLKDKEGKPTRLALSARAWGEPAPKTMESAKKLAAKGRRLLEQAKKAA